MHRDFSKVCGLSESIQRGLCIGGTACQDGRVCLFSVVAPRVNSGSRYCEDDTNLKDERLASILRCPRCDGKVIFIERKGASIALTSGTCCLNQTQGR